MLRSVLEELQLPVVVWTHADLLFRAHQGERTLRSQFRAQLHALVEQYPYPVLVLDHVEQWLPGGGGDNGSNKPTEKAWLLEELFAWDGFVIGVTTTTASADNSAISTYARRRFFQWEWQLRPPNPAQRMDILRQCIAKSRRDLMVAAARTSGHGSIKRWRVMDCGDVDRIQAWIDQCHGFLAADIQCFWTHVMGHALRRAVPGGGCNTDDDNADAVLVIEPLDLDHGLVAAKASASLLRSSWTGGSRFLLTQRAENKVQWEDIGGLAEVKRLLQDTVHDRSPAHQRRFQELCVAKAAEAKAAAAAATTSRGGAASHRMSTPPTPPPIVKFLPLRATSGVLLYGPPGTGKTMLAKAVASQCQANFLPVAMPELVKAAIGESEKALATVFQLARDGVPCVLFLDEVDALFGGGQGGLGGGGGQGGGHGGGGRHDSSSVVLGKLRSQLLLEMDRVNANNGGADVDGSDSGSGGVLVLAATNVPSALSSDLLAAGRLERHVLVPPPDAHARWAILRAVLGKMTVTPTLQQALAVYQAAALPATASLSTAASPSTTFSPPPSPLSPPSPTPATTSAPHSRLSVEQGQEQEHALASLVRRTSGYSGADLRNLCHQAGMLALRREPSVRLDSSGGSGGGRGESEDDHCHHRNDRGVSVDDLERALDTTVPSLQPALVQKYYDWQRAQHSH